MIHLILIPFFAGAVCLIVPKIKELTAVIISLFTFIYTCILFFSGAVDSRYFIINNLSRFILPAIGLFGFLIVLYSLKFMSGKNRLSEYYTYILWTIGASIGVVLANNLLLLLFFWGFLGFTLYMLIGIGAPDSTYSAKKTFIIVGGSDALMIMGIGIIWLLSGTFEIDKINISLNNSLSITAFIFISIAAFAKAGAMPMHTWIPDSAETAPLPVVAFLPAALDKLLGIYLLAKISMDIFIITPNSPISIFLLIIGAGTVVAAAMMALIQQNAKKLLSYSTVSQVGYIVLGIGTGIPVGIAGGIFHTLNHAVYKCCLFLTAGNVEHRTGTTELNRLGGLAKAMPVTFLSFLIAGLSISGVPPFNGFVSKWMVYQGIIELGKNGGLLWPLWLICAMFGSALTLAGFMKLLYAIFLGQKPQTGNQSPKEVTWSMWLPAALLAGLCIIFGIFANQIPLKYFIYPAVNNIKQIGIWYPGIATILIITGLILGYVIYRLGNLKNVRVDNSCFIGGEVLPDAYRVTGTDFYNTIKDIGVLKFIYKRAEEKAFDIYEEGVKYSLKFTEMLRSLHNGILPTYLAWCLLGMIVLFFIFK